MSHYDYAFEKIDKTIPLLNDKKIAIFPCGEFQKVVKDYLEVKHNLRPDYLIDNNKANNNDSYIAVDKLHDIDCNAVLFFIASNSKKYYKEIRDEIRKYVPDINIIDLCPQILDKPTIADLFIEKILWPHGRVSFIRSLKNKVGLRVLDVGCGNESPQIVKSILNKIYYVGLDVGDYNQSEESKGFADEYHIVRSEEFAPKIESYSNMFDVVISSHNIEHCDDPDRVLVAMIGALKKGGKLYLSFPSEQSVYFPRGRRGCLNFYDDRTHQKIPNWKNICDIMSQQGMKIVFSTRNNSPYLMRKIGALNEARSSEMKRVLVGTWEYYGFESIIWAKKR